MPKAKPTKPATQKPRIVKDDIGVTYVKSLAGRPTSYDPKFCEQVVRLGAQGKSIAQMAANIGVAKSTLYLWEKENPEFSDALTYAKTLSQSWWENKGQINLNENDFQVPLWTKQVSCRFPEDYRENKQTLEHTGKDGSPIELIRRVIVDPNNEDR
jgi:DNA-binding XRE family transcriptional regulator